MTKTVPGRGGGRKMAPKPGFGAPAGTPGGTNSAKFVGIRSKITFWANSGGRQTPPDPKRRSGSSGPPGRRPAASRLPLREVGPAPGLIFSLPRTRPVAPGQITRVEPEGGSPSPGKLGYDRNGPRERKGSVQGPQGASHRKTRPRNAARFATVPRQGSAKAEAVKE